jgi:hypothetical protein
MTNLMPERWPSMTEVERRAALLRIVDAHGRREDTEDALINLYQRVFAYEAHIKKLEAEAAKRLGETTVVFEQPAIERLLEALKAAEAQVETLKGKIFNCDLVVKSHRVQVETLDAALKDYGRHVGECGAPMYPCECGFDKALREVGRV